MPDGGSPGPSLVWLDRPLPPPRDRAADPRIAQVRGLSNKGEYEQAARIAEGILADGVGDVLALSRYLFGVFLAKGFVVLPRILDAMGRACEATLAGGDRRAAADAELSLGWLCRTARDRVDFHLMLKDATWRGWVDASDPALCDAIGAACARLMKTLEASPSGARSLESVASLDAFGRGTLRGLVPLPKPPPPPPPAPPTVRAPEAAEEPAPEAAEEPAPEPLPEPAPRHVASDRDGGHPHAPGHAPGDDDAPAMALLRRKLAGFQDLVDRGDLARAAIVARDIERIVEHFDPRVYLPRLFAPHFRRLAASSEALGPYWEGEGTPGWRAFEQLYQVDLDAFLEDEVR